MWLKAFGIQVFDISTPSAPALQGGVYPLNSASGIAVAGNSVLIADYYSGLTLVPAQCLASTPVLLSFLHASPESGGILLEWATREESEFAGFHVVRSAEPQGAFETISRELIAPPSPYRYLDTAVAPGVTYYYRLRAVDRSGVTRLVGLVSATPGPGKELRPRLDEASPNPSEGSDTNLSFVVARGGLVKLRILDIAGREIRRLIDEPVGAGEHSISWDGRNDRGELVPSGIYLYELLTPGFKASKRLVRLR
jgi:hypothetical protein